MLFSVAVDDLLQAVRPYGRGESAFPQLLDEGRHTEEHWRNPAPVVRASRGPVLRWRWQEVGH